MSHECRGKNAYGIGWECYENNQGEMILQSEGIPDSIRVSYCPFCGTGAQEFAANDSIIYQLKQYCVIED